MTGKFHFFLMGVGQNTELQAQWSSTLQAGWRWVTQPQSGENKIFHHLGKAGSEPKLTDFQEKNS
jgi:hypothetical protein